MIQTQSKKHILEVRSLKLTTVDLHTSIQYLDKSLSSLKMEQKEIEILDHFLTRTSMWIHPINESTIVSFIHGFEAGVGKKTFTTKVQKFLESEYDIYGSNLGWPHQIRIYSEKNSITWVEAYMKIGKRIIKN